MPIHCIDVAVVGGGPAGLSTALHLVQAAPHLTGRVVVLEKARYPRDKICAGAIGARGLRVLAALGVHLDAPMVTLNALILRIGGEVVEVREPGLGVVVRRVEFDHALAREAGQRGIEVRDGCGVTGVTVSQDAVHLHTDTGDVYRARVIVGADGVGGIVRRDTGFVRGRFRAQAVELDTDILADDAPRDTLVFDFHTPGLRGYAWDFPTLVEGTPRVCRGVYVTGPGGRSRGEAGAGLTAYLGRRGLDPARYRLRQFAEQGFEPGAAIAAPRVLLVGEAAGIDIATGEGIALAIEYGALAGPYLARALTTGDLAFADWRQRVDRIRLGRQLRLRHLGYRAFYGRRRSALERVVPQIPTLLHVLTREFAGKRLSARAVVEGGAEWLGAMTRERAWLG